MKVSYINFNGYKFIIEFMINNKIYLLEQKNYTIKNIDSIDCNEKINKNNKTINVYIDINKVNENLYNNIIENSYIDLIELIELFNFGIEKFVDYEINLKLYKILQNHINNFNVFNSKNLSYFWYNLTNYEDFYLHLFKNRKLPYFQLENKEWKLTNINNLNNSKNVNFDYPEELFKNTQNDNNLNNLTSATNSNNLVKIEKKLVQNEHNFNVYKPIIPENYENIFPIINLLEILVSLNLHDLKQQIIFYLLLNPNYIHIIKESKFWDIIYNCPDANFHKLINYCYYYTLYLFRQEEILMFNNVPINTRVIFSLNEAAKLPNYTVHIERNPYIQQLTDELNLYETIPFYINEKRKILNEEQFNNRFLIATGGIFKDINLKELNCSITGSILIPCVHINPLENNFNNSEFKINYDKFKENPSQDDKNFINYLEFYYPGYNSLNNNEYETYVLNNKDHNETIDFIIKNSNLDNLDNLDNLNNLNNLNNLDNLNNLNNETKEKETKENYLIINKKINKLTKKIENELKLENNILENEINYEDFDNTMNNIKNHKIDKKKILKKNTKSKFNQNITSNITNNTSNNTNITSIITNNTSNITNITSNITNDKDENTKNMKYTCNKLSDIDISVTTNSYIEFNRIVYKLYNLIKNNCKNRGDVYIQKIETITTYKYSIHGPGLLRPIDIFKITYSPSIMVKKFHLNCVKMYYDGNLYMFRSCISSLISGVNEFYNWFSCNKVPSDVILKYTMRGISTILNKNEIENISSYLLQNTEWSKLFNDLNINPKNICCIVDKNHKFFNISADFIGIRHNLKKLHLENYNNIINKHINYPDDKFKYGNLFIKDTKKISPPNMQIIDKYIKNIVN